MNNKPLFGLPSYVLDNLNALFHNYPAIDHVVIYGSRAKGNYQLGSDIDLCLDASTMNLTDFFKLETQIDDLLLPWKIDLCLKTQIDNPMLLEHIERCGIVIYSSQS